MILQIFCIRSFVWPQNVGDAWSFKVSLWYQYVSSFWCFKCGSMGKVGSLEIWTPKPPQVPWRQRIAFWRSLSFLEPWICVRSVFVQLVWWARMFTEFMEHQTNINQYLRVLQLKRHKFDVGFDRESFGNLKEVRRSTFRDSALIVPFEATESSNIHMARWHSVQERTTPGIGLRYALSNSWVFVCTRITRKLNSIY